MIIRGIIKNLLLVMIRHGIVALTVLWTLIKCTVQVDGWMGEKMDLYIKDIKKLWQLLWVGMSNVIFFCIEGHNFPSRV